ncbi:uncharacterized protein LOC127835840 [Dreissena polymorpha]|uniref:B box-type domain-containing protein n=1 Tax=Dreissena polymorpha TaxID=45954 RepID=A0A9D4G7P2_DREPO|nr:uncharacterized protein LOC127835840 [Dreissena polymorpha]KAH3811988.1 hypothetical protein DPMN_140408 [Dreissena polymorpha]
MTSILNKSIEILTARTSNASNRKKERDKKVQDVTPPEHVVGRESAVTTTVDEIQAYTPYNKCEEHDGEPEELYCVQHSSMVCVVCRRLYHPKCKEILRVDEACANFCKGEAPDKCREHVRELLRKCHAVAREREWDLTDLDRKKADIINSLLHEKQTIVAKVEKLYENAKADLERLYTVERTEMKNHLLSLKQMSASLDERLKAVESKKASDSDLETFVAVQNARDKHKKMTSALVHIHDEAHKVFLKFHVSEMVETAMKCLHSLGELSLNTMEYAVIPKLNQADEPGLELSTLNRKPPEEHTIRKHVMDRTVTPAGEIFVRDREDAETCWITGMCILKDSTLIVVDNNNNRVKVIDPRGNIVNSFRLASPPFDIALINQAEAAFTLPDKKQVQVIRIVGRSDIKYGENIQFDFDCNGIGVLGDNIVLTSISEKCVRMVNQKGEVLWTAVTDDLGERIFEWPWYVATSSSFEKVYVSDRRKNTVTTLDQNGTLLNVRDIRGKGPRGLAVDDVGNMFMCHYMTDELEIISLDYPRDRKVLLTKVDGIKHPQSLAYDEEKGQILLSANNSDYVNVFQMK